MFNGTYDSDDNGSGYADDFIPGKKDSYHPLNNIIKDDDISDAFKEATGADENGYGEEDYEGQDESWE